MPSRDAPWVYDLRIPGLQGEQQTRIVRALNESGIAARHGFKPMHAQEEYKNCKRIGGEQAEKAAREVFYLLIRPGETTWQDVQRAFEIIHRTLG